MIEDKGENSHFLDLITFSFDVSESVVINDLCTNQGLLSIVAEKVLYSC
jgi:hypothetical protein